MVDWKIRYVPAGGIFGNNTNTPNEPANLSSTYFNNRAERCLTPPIPPQKTDRKQKKEEEET